ncbi:DUF2800 domain-containing protein [Alteromonas mediterranea]|uniref:DUF2800 domain-containing protein n=1 Tax=Alteromonas mediterranea TaxID=314275 RepID=UPI0032B17AA4
MKHSQLGASKAHRWMTCPASVSLEATFPDEESFYAAEGTAAHALAEMCLKSQKPPESYMGVEVEGFVVDELMAYFVAMYVDFCNSQEGKGTIEQRVDYSDWADGGFGTADYCVINEGICHVIDLKYGQGVKVSAQRNEQLMLYALGAMHDADEPVDTVQMTIVQPRLDHIDSYSLAAKDLYCWANEKVKPAARRVFAPDPAFNPSPKACHFCKAKATCRALAKHNYELTLSSFDNLEEPLLVQVPHTLNVDEIGNLLPKMDALIGWAQGVQKHAHKLLMEGGILPDYKLVAGRSQRKWVDEQVAEESLIQILGDKAHVSKLVSPAQAEKLLGKAKAGEVTDLWHKPDGRPTLAPDSDPRPAVKPEAVDLFSEIQ